MNERIEDWVLDPLPPRVAFAPMVGTKGTLLLLAGGAILSMLVRHSVFMVVGTSMEPALSPHALVLAAPLLTWQQPARGEVVVVTPRRGALSIKRVTAIAGDCIDEFGRTSTRSVTFGEADSCMVLRDGQFFVLGDNRRSSTDSRSYGPIDREAIMARVAIQIWPRLSKVSGDRSRREQSRIDHLRVAR